MRTTIEIPDEILRRVKATAALRGMKLKDLVAQLLEVGLRNGEPAQARRKRRELPTMIPATGRSIPLRSNAELFEILDRDDTNDGRLS